MRRNDDGRPQEASRSRCVQRVVALGEVADHHRRLGLPVVLGEDRPEPLDRLGQPHRVDRRGAVVDRLERGQVARVRVRVVHQGVEHRGHQHGGGDLLLLDGPQHLGRVEARQHVERPALHHRRHEERCAGVRERRAHQEARRLRPLPLGELHLRHRGHRLRGADDALRLAGGPTGVGDRDDVVGRRAGPPRAAAARTPRPRQRGRAPRAASSSGTGPMVSTWVRPGTFSSRPTARSTNIGTGSMISVVMPASSRT